jgi:hypothetical protein
MNEDGPSGVVERVIVNTEHVTRRWDIIIIIIIVFLKG